MVCLNQIEKKKRCLFVVTDAVETSQSLSPTTLQRPNDFEDISCSQRVCHHGGSCEESPDDSSRTRCVCESEYKGDDCSRPVSLPESSNCKSNQILHRNSISKDKRVNPCHVFSLRFCSIDDTSNLLRLQFLPQWCLSPDWPLQNLPMWSRLHRTSLWPYEALILWRRAWCLIYTFVFRTSERNRMFVLKLLQRRMYRLVKWWIRVPMWDGLYWNPMWKYVN